MSVRVARHLEWLGRRSFEGINWRLGVCWYDVSLASARVEHEFVSKSGTSLEVPRDGAAIMLSPLEL
jgi:hypothetical protein